MSRAAALFEAGFSCAEAVAGAFAEHRGLGRDAALRAAGAFGAGMSRTGQTCGAVSGALLVLGLVHGRTDAADGEAKERAYALGARFCERFQAANGGLSCPALLGVDISSPAVRKAAADAGLFKTRCPALVRSAAEILDAMI